MSVISSTDTVGVSARYAAQIRELLAAHARQREAGKASDSRERAAEGLRALVCGDSQIDELA